MSGPETQAPTPEPADGTAAPPFEQLLVTHQNRIYFFIRSMVFNPDEARDVLQDVNAIIIRKHGQFIPGTDFKSWSFAIARFECMTYLRKYKSRSSAPANEQLLAYLSEGAESHSDRIDAWLEALGECRKLLATEGNELLDLRYQTRVPLEQIAIHWKTSEGALKQKLFRIRNQLKHCILKKSSGHSGESENE